MTITILTLFPEMFSGPFDYSIIKRAQAKGLVSLTLTNIRDFSSDAYKSVDDHPYGGGVGMVMRVDVIDRALNSVIPGLTQNPSLSKTGSRLGGRDDKTRTVLLDPQGTPYTQAKAKELSSIDHLILICGHYEGVDERVRELVDESVSIGDYVLTGGEIPAMVVVDSIVRLLPGVLKKDTATEDESFTRPLLEYPQYTKPQEYKHMRVPDVLVSGNHAAIEMWKKEQQSANTKNRRPDLAKKATTN